MKQISSETSESIIVRFTVKPSEFETLKRMLAELLKDMKQFDDCLAAHACFDTGTNEIVMFQVWTSSQAQSDYLSWRAERGDLEQMFEMLADEPDFSNYETLAGYE